MLWIYGLVGLSVITSLQLYSFSGATQTKFRTTLAGGTGSGIFYNYFSNWTSTIDFLQFVSDGGMGNVGYFYIAGLAAIIGVWGWNLATSRKYLIR